MLTPAQTQFAQLMVQAAKDSGHPFPDYAAAECCLESEWGVSGLAIRDKDVFGLKAPSWWTGQIDDIHTREVLNGISVMVDAKWPVFETYADAFSARLHVLKAMPLVYGEALGATNGAEFVRLVSAQWGTLSANSTAPSPSHPVVQFPSGVYQFIKSRWSTDPLRAKSVIQTHDSHPEIFHV